MLAAEATFGVLQEGLNLETYWDALQNSWIWEELYRARNYRPVRSNSLSPPISKLLFPWISIYSLKLYCASL